MGKQVISICIPVLNEFENLTELIERLNAVAIQESSRYEFEFIFTDNQSDDGTWEFIDQLSIKQENIRAIRFTKNIGHQKSILMNYSFAKGDAVVQIDADLQDPPELIIEFLRKWEKGFKVVSGVRFDRSENWFKKRYRQFGYVILDHLSDHPVTRNVGDFRLLDRRVIDELMKLKTTEPFLRGMISKLGFPESLVQYNRPDRKLGKSKFSLRELTKLGIGGIFGNSTVVLRISIWIGMAWLVLAVLGAIFYIVLKLLGAQLPQGLVSTLVIIFIGFGINSFMLGVLGIYITRIISLIGNEPIAVISETLNLDYNKYLKRSNFENE